MKQKASKLLTLMFILIIATTSNADGLKKHTENDELQHSIASGEESFNTGPDLNLDSQEDNLLDDENSIAELKGGPYYKDCTILYWNGVYQKPNIVITKRRVQIKRGVQVTKAQLRHVGSGAIRLYGRDGTFRIPNGEYVLSLHGSTFGRRSISACAYYDK